MKPETAFRISLVIPFLKTLKHTTFFPIQQMAINGDPDFLLCIRGEFVALELKDVGSHPRPLQIYKLKQIERTGGKIFVADRSNWVTIKEQIKQLDKGVLNCKSLRKTPTSPQ